MSIPLPPSPPPPPTLPQTEPLKCSSEGNVRSALLADIQRGIKLKKVTQVNDCSAPVLHKPNISNSEDNGNGGPTRGSAGSAPVTQGPTLSGLFAGGFPVLRPVGQQNRSTLNRPVTRSGSTASLQQPQWNLPSQEQSFTGSTPDLSPSRKPLARTSSLSRPRPVSSYTAPPSPSQTTPPSYKSLFSPPPMPSLHPERSSNRPPPVPTCPPPPPPQITKPTWLPVQSHSIPMPTTPPPLAPPSSIPDRPSPLPSDTKYSNFRSSLPPPPPPHSNSVPCSFSSSLSPPPPPPPPKALTMPAYKPTVSAPGHSYPCRRPPPIPRSAGAARLAPPPAPPARAPSTELSSRIPPPPPPPPLPQAPPSSVRNGHLYSLDDFESKFQFHPVEDFPPPEAFRHFPRVYPSKENRVCLQPPGVRTYLR